jgi:hypothetical protein
MSPDEFTDVSRVIAGSFPGRLFRAAAAGVRAAGPRSVLGAVFIRTRSELARMSSGERIRLAGVMLLTAAVTHDVLVGLVPAIVRPGAPRAIRGAAAVIGLAMMLLAPALERAWKTSRLRRWWHPAL